MPEIPDVATGETIASQWGNDIRDRTVQRYVSAAQRTSEHPSPTQGDLSFLEDSAVVDVYGPSGWVPIAASSEVDGHDEVAGPVVLTSSYATVASVVLSIPSGWGSWKCVAQAFFLSSGTGGVGALIRIDGTATQGTDNSTPDVLALSVGGRRTGMTTTGNRTIALQAAEAGGQEEVSAIYLYARAVRTS